MKTGCWWGQLVSDSEFGVEERLGIAASLQESDGNFLMER